MEKGLWGDTDQEPVSYRSRRWGGEWGSAGQEDIAGTVSA